MIDKGDMACDPRGLIFEAYRIDGITIEDCRAIFFDWALGVPPQDDTVAHVKDLLDRYGTSEHPMTQVLEEGLQALNRPKGRKGGRRARVTD